MPKTGPIPSHLTGNMWAQAWGYLYKDLEPYPGVAPIDVTPVLTRKYTPEKMVKLGPERIEDLIKTIGLFRNKAKNVHALSHKLVEEFGGKVPETREALESLPGVGRKTANVVLNVAFGQPTIAVDTHLFRVANRTGLAPGDDPLAVELGLLKTIPERYLLHAHHWLILHGRYVCKARKPECWRCVVRDWCLFEPKTPPPKEARNTEAAAATAG